MGLFSKKAKPEYEKVIDDYSPEGKDYDWFRFSIGQKVFEEYTTPKGYFCWEERDAEKSLPGSDLYEEDEFMDIYSLVKTFKAGRSEWPKIPFVYLTFFIKSLSIRALEKDEFVRSCFLRYMIDLSKRYVLNEDEEPVVNIPPLSLEEVVTIEKNPALNFYYSFDNELFDLIYSLENSNEGRDLIFESFQFIAQSLWNSKANKNNILEKNKWVFEKSTYINDSELIRSKKSYLKLAIQNASDNSYFKEVLSDIDH